MVTSAVRKDKDHLDVQDDIDHFLKQTKTDKNRK